MNHRSDLHPSDSLAKGHPHFTGQGALEHAQQLCTTQPQLAAKAPNRDSAGTSGIARENLQSKCFSLPEARGCARALLHPDFLL